MPYRRLPQSNPSRDRALSTCKEKMDATPAANQPFSPALGAELIAGQPAFHTLITAVNTAKYNQTHQSEAVAPLHRVARFWVNHGYQALINACIRGQFSNTVKNLYGLALDAMGGPDMDSDSKLLQAATTYNDAESQRVVAGETPISFPDLVDINLHVDAFRTGNQTLSTLKGIYDAAQEALAAADPHADLLILRLWNAIEANFDKGDKPSMRRKAREWGLVYIPSKGETPSGDDFSVIGEIKNINTNLPLANVEVLMTNGLIGVQFTTDTDGMYYLQVVSSGTYDLSITLAGYEPFTTVVEVIEGEVQEVNISLTPVMPLLPPAE